MSNYATTTGNPGRREKRPPTLVTAEVLRKRNQSNAEESVDAPPAFSGKKLRGAKRFLDQEPLVADETQNDDLVKGIDDLPGVRLEAPSRSSSSAVSREETHPFAAPAGWRRYWGQVDADICEDPDIILSVFCKSCCDEEKTHSCGALNVPVGCAQRREKYLDPCANCRMSSQECLYLITYKPQPNVGTYKSRRLERERAHASTIGLSVPTRNTTFSPVVPLPPKPEPSQRTPAEPTQSGKERTTPITVAKPTYSRVMDSYHDLKSWAMKESGHGRKQEGIAWINDLKAHEAHFRRGARSIYLPAMESDAISSLPSDETLTPGVYDTQTHTLTNPNGSSALPTQVSPSPPSIISVRRAQNGGPFSEVSSTHLQDREQSLGEMRTLGNLATSADSYQERKELLLKEMRKLCALSIQDMLGHDSQQENEEIDEIR